MLFECLQNQKCIEVNTSIDVIIIIIITTVFYYYYYYYNVIEI